MMPTPAYVYAARLIEDTDGDTIVVERDLGDHIYQRTAVRVRNVNSPEVHGATKLAGEEAAAFTRAWLAEAGDADWPLVIETHLNKREKYGRLLAFVWRVSDGRELSADLLAAHQAAPFMTGKN